MEKNFFKEIIKESIENKLDRKQFMQLRTKLSKKYKLSKLPSLIEILSKCNEKEREILLPILKTKPTRTLSGVTPIAVMTKPLECPHGKCTYCPGGPGSAFGDVPQSYTGNEPSTMRAIRSNYDPYLIVFNRLEQFTILGHIPDKVDLIIQGGTFPAFEKEYQNYVVTYCLKAMNDFSKQFFPKNKFNYKKFKNFFEIPADMKDKEREKRVVKKILRLKKESNLEKEQLKNETSRVRCIGLTIETKPDWALLDHGNLMLQQGCTRVELGVQSVYPEVIKKVHRGHTIKDTISSIRILKDLGFKLNFHYMLGLPLTSRKMDLEGLKELFNNEDYMPDMLKIYPTLVMKGTPLYIQYKNNKYNPINTEEAADIISDFKEFIPRFCRIHRIQRDIPTFVTEAGPDKTNLRQYVDKKLKEKGITCNCIRCREAGRNSKIENIKIYTKKYKASKGTEFFISAEDKKNNVLIGFCRLRFPSQILRKEITNRSGLIRELHVYGTETPLGEKGDIQHKGWGKKLMLKAEEICKKNNKNRLIVISGIGVKEYYINKLGYKKEGPYVTKLLNQKL